MTQEEKARRYNEALANARQEYDTTENVERKQWLEELFPELKESEDERIRNGLIALLKFSLEDGSAIAPGFNETKEQALTWLEKQGEPLNESVYDTEDKEIYQAISIGLTDVFNECGWSDFGGIPIENIQKWLEKQGEQKETLCDKCKKAQPSHSCQDITALGRCAIEKQDEKSSIRERYDRIKDSEWFKKTHEGMSVSNDEEPKWTEEDECYMGECISAIATKDSWSCEEKRKTKYWLTTIKQRMEE